MGPSISISCLLSRFELFSTVCGRPNNSSRKTSMSPLELVNVTLHGKRHLEDMIELRIVQWEDYLDPSRRVKCNHLTFVSPDRMTVMLRPNLTTDEPPLVAEGFSLMQCMDFWTDGTELPSHRFLGRISGLLCLCAAQDPMNHDRYRFSVISCFPRSTLPDIQSFPKRTTHTRMWPSQEILHVLPVSLFVGDELSDKVTMTGLGVKSQALEVICTQLHTLVIRTWEVIEKNRGNTEAILTPLARGNERQWCIGTAFETLLKSKREMKKCFLLILAGLTFLRD